MVEVNNAVIAKLETIERQALLINELRETLDSKNETIKNLLFELADAQAEAANLRRENEFLNEQVADMTYDWYKQDANPNEQE